MDHPDTDPPHLADPDTPTEACEGPRSELAAPDQVGPFRILSLLGAGGMGEVYLAEQRSPVQRRVALKVVKLGMDTRDVVRRFFDGERARRRHAGVGVRRG